MITRLIVSILTLGAWMLLAVASAGCASASPSQTDPPRPIDQVRADIASSRAQLAATLAAAGAVVAEPLSDVSRKRQAFEKEVRATDTQIQQLRANALELKQRAGEYFTMWGGNVATFQPDAGGLASQTNAPRQRIKAKYDEMVDALIRARDAMEPFRADLTALESTYREEITAARLSSIKPEVQRATSQGQAVISHLDVALTRLDELKALAENANAPRAQ